jgi:hypothetical protein
MEELKELTNNLNEKHTHHNLLPVITKRLIKNCLVKLLNAIMKHYSITLWITFKCIKFVNFTNFNEWNISFSTIVVPVALLIVKKGIISVQQWIVNCWMVMMLTCYTVIVFTVVCLDQGHCSCFQKGMRKHLCPSIWVKKIVWPENMNEQVLHGYCK